MKISSVFKAWLFIFALTTLAQAQRVADLSGNGIPEAKVTVIVTCRAAPSEMMFTTENVVLTDANGYYSLSISAPCATPNVGPPFVTKPGYSFARVCSVPCVFQACDTCTNDFIGTNLPPLLSVSAASYASEQLASEMLATAFGTGLAPNNEAATGTPLPTQLANRRLLVKDRLGVEKAAELLFISPSQVNFILPSGLARGAAVFKLIADNQIIRAGFAQIERVAPGLFTANAEGRGIAAALVLRIKADGSQQYEPVAQFDAAQKKFSAVPIDLGTEAEQVFLVLFGTGWRNRSSLAGVTVTIGGTDVEALYAGPQLQHPGLDQINVRLPRALAGRGEVEVKVRIDSYSVNPVNINIR